jgi:glycosyltransferase involved in cell wall biosynthesis
MKILFLSTRRAKPSFRFRVEQILPFFAQRGHSCDVVFLPGSAWKRLQCYRLLRNYDAVFLQKRLLSRAELSLIRRCVRRLIYDVDDAVMYNAQGETDSRRQTRFQAVARSADLVICGNQYLADIASQHSDRVLLVPTSIDTETFHPRLRAQQNAPNDLVVDLPQHNALVTVGWTGSSSTNRFLNDVFPVLSKLAGRIHVKFISDSTRDLDLDALAGVPYTFVPWSTEIEVSETATFDIGLMPLPDNPWTRGKCGFKALQYLALGIPAVCSPVGVNREIIRHGHHGFLADSPESWSEILAALVEDPQQRERIGQAGRRRVEEAYALNTQGPRIVEAVERLLTAGRRSA